MASRGVIPGHTSDETDSATQLNEFSEMAFSVNGASANDRTELLQPESNPYEYRCRDHPATILQTVSHLYETRHLTDVTLSADGQTFDAHRVVLAAGSPYFNAMFTNAHIESTQDHIVLNGLDGESLGTLLEFIYTSRLSITETNVQNLLAGASLLQITAVVDACCQFLLVRLDPDNCLGICNFADIHGCTSLYAVSWEFALQHFGEVCQTEEFLTVPPSLLKNLLMSESLQIQSEEEVLEAVIRWYQHDSPARHEAFVSLLKYIKLPLIPYTVLSQKLSSIPRIANDPKCQKLLASARTFQTREKSSPEQQLSIPADFNPYAARKFQKQLIYIVGGETDPGRSMTPTVEEFDPMKETFTKLQSLTSCRRGVGVCLLDGLLYAVGGSDGLQALKLAECYNPEMNNWTRITDLNECRSSVATVVVNSVFYAVGGYDGIMNCLMTVEKYDPASNTWSYIKSMNVSRSMMSVGVIGKNVYCVGGYDGTSDLASCEVYDTESDTWTMLPPMHSCRCMAGVGVVNNQLYVIGGCDCAKSLNTAEVYNLDSKTWTVIPEMAEARSGLGVAVIGHLVYAVGGYTGTSYCTSIEKYDAAIGQWSKVTDMPSGRRRFGCCS